MRLVHRRINMRQRYVGSCQIELKGFLSKLESLSSHCWSLPELVKKKSDHSRDKTSWV